MEHPTIKNDFFNRPVDGPKKEISLRNAVEMAIGYRTYMSKRLSPPGCICNGRIYTKDGEFIYSSDIDVFKNAASLRVVAEMYETELFIFHEHGSSYCWKSSEPNMWQGGCAVDDTWEEKPQPFEKVIPYFEESHKRRVRQWKIDHGIIRRNPKEWFKDAWYRWKTTPMEVRYYLRQKDMTWSMKIHYTFRWIFCI